jgi:hypothetical protein
MAKLYFWTLVVALAGGMSPSALHAAPEATEGVLAQLGAAQIPPPANLVSLQQVTWDLDAGRVADSDWGQIEIRTRPPFPEALGSAGYVNVFLPDPIRTAAVQWVVNNLYVAISPACGETGPPRRNSLPSTAYFDLRPGVEGSGRVLRLQTIVVFSQQPLPNISRVRELVASLAPTVFTVQPVVVNAEGYLGESGESTARVAATSIAELVGPPPQAIIVGPDLPADLGFPILVTQAIAPNIEAAQNQCVPMSIANAYGYLEQRYDNVPLAWSLPHSPIPGIGRTTVSGDVIGWQPDPETSLIAQVDYRTTREGVFSFLTGAGSDLCQMVHGAFGYLAAHGGQAAATFRHQGSVQFLGDTNVEPEAHCSGGPFGFPGFLSTRQGEHPTWQWIFEQLQAGRAVVMCFGFYDVGGNRTGGHMLRVWGAGHLNGRNYLYTLDDGNQGLPTNGGIRTQSWEVADTGQPGLAGIPDGQLNMGGTNWEIEFAMSIEAKPTLNIP